MEFAVEGWPPNGPQLQLDHRSFSYAGKFVMTNTGKAVVRDDGVIVAAASFSPDRTDDQRMWIRYLTVHTEYRGDGIGTTLVTDLTDRILARQYTAVRIAVNNPFAYAACYRAGFGFTCETTGLAELVLDTDAPTSVPLFEAGLQHFANRSTLSSAERSYLELLSDRGPPRDTGS